VEISWGGRRNEDAFVTGTRQVSEHSSECSPKRRSGVLHELGEFVSAEGNVWASKAQVLEASNERSILGWGR